MKKSQTPNFKYQKKVFLSILLLFTVHYLLFAVAAFASEGGGTGEAHFTYKDWLWPVINFFILIFVLVFFARKPFSEFFKNRTALIEKSLREASEAKEIAQKTLNEVRERLKNTDSEIEQILAAARKSGEKEKEAIIAEGERLKERSLSRQRPILTLNCSRQRKR